MKRGVLLLGAVLVATICFAQGKIPVKWAFASKKINSTTYEIHLTAMIEGGWHVYSQSTPDGGPIATTIVFTKNPLAVLQGNVKEVGKLEQRFEPLFGVDVKQYSNKVNFVQTIKLKNSVKTSLNGTVEYMTCNDHECLPPAKQNFSIALN